MRRHGADEEAPPLTWRVWILLPLVAIGLFGLVVPLWGVHGRVPGMPSSEEEPLPRQPYEDELLELIRARGPDLSARELESLDRLHRRCRRARDAAGTVPGKLRQRVDDLLEKYR